MNRHRIIPTKAVTAVYLVVAQQAMLVRQALGLLEVLLATPVQLLALLVEVLAVAQVVQHQVAAQQAANQVVQVLLVAAVILVDLR